MNLKPTATVPQINLKVAFLKISNARLYKSDFVWQIQLI